MQKDPFTTGAEFHAGMVYYIDRNKIHKNIQTSDIFSKRRIVVFGGPAPFSKLDTEQALLFEKASKEILALGIDAIAAIYVQDAFVNEKFRQEISGQAGSDNLEYYADGDAFFSRGLELTHDFTFQGLGVRTGRWAAVVNNCIAEWAAFDEYQIIDQTHPNKVLEWLKKKK
jgi:peroxiredoxin